jgi:ATP-dependent helicase HrpB
VPRTDHGRGLDALVTVRVSRASAHQRAGRAGREGAGRVYRCWSEVDHERLAAYADPEIAGADLTSFILQLACWGSADGTGLALLDQPPAAAAQVAHATLTALGALDHDGRVTVRGRDIAAVGAHPRLARALLDASEQVGTARAAEVVALLSMDSPVGGTDDLAAVWRRLRDGVDRAATAVWHAEVRRLRRAARDSGRGELPDDLAAALVVGLAFPERLARARTPGGRSYLMAGGTAAELTGSSGLSSLDWLAIASADRQPGSSSARIRLAAPADEATARLAGAPLLVSEDEVAWSDGDVVARHVTRLGAVILTERAIAKPDPDLVAQALAEGLRRAGMRLLRWDTEALRLRERLAFCAHALGEPWPQVGDEQLLARADEWLGPDLARARRRDDLARIDLSVALRRLLPWAQAAQLDSLAPERLEVPSGSRVRVDYADPATPVLAVKVQEVFGWTQTPRLAAGRVPVVLHLLSPAGRPAAVTGDLVSFWRNGYPQVRAELRGRYPRHAWPQDPSTAEPTRRTRPRT